MDAHILAQVQLQILSLSLLMASLQEEEANSSNRKEDEGNLTPPVPAITAAQLGIELHQKFGGGKNLKLAKTIAQQQSLTVEDIDAILDFFENSQLDESDLGWGNYENPSSDWIRYLLMGSYPCLHWARAIKNWLNGQGEKPVHKIGFPPLCSPQELM